MEKQLINIMEQIVLDRIGELSSNLDCCACEYCRADIAALALNQMKPKYVVTEKGALYSKLSLSNLYDAVDLNKKIAQAAEIVRAHPRHPSEKNGKK